MRRKPGWALLGVFALAGCTDDSALNPVTWWHSVEGGRIADPRPAPPGADQPWPNLSTVPARPEATSATQRARIAGALVADRANAQYAVRIAPLPTPPAPTAQAGAPPAPAPGRAPEGEGLSATMQAAEAPAAPRPAPRTQVNASPLAPPPTPTPAPTSALGPAEAAAAAAGQPPPPLPDIPAAPPPPASLPGVVGFTVPTPPAPTPPPPPAPPPEFKPGEPVTIAFAASSATLPANIRPVLAKLAQTRGGAPLGTVGFGDADSSDPEVQAAAMRLAFERANAIAQALQGLGVPREQIHVTAQAIGRGGVARVDAP